MLEGGDGSGKSTQVELLVARLREAGHEVVATFEPGATADRRGDPRAAARRDGPGRPDGRGAADGGGPGPARRRGRRARAGPGAWVVSDRHLPSSLAYQGVARGLGVDAVEAVNRLAVDGVTPDLVVLLDVADDVATRAPGRWGGGPPRA